MNPPFKMIVETEIEKYRYETFWTKEPETIEWIRSFKNGDVFIDVGANIGIYSFYAASLFPDSVIYAIEPEHRNYRRLLENLELNNFLGIVPFNLAFSNTSGVSIFSVPKIEIGSSGGQIKADNGAADAYYIPVMTFEDFRDIFRIGWRPGYHIKIDVDGQEDKILSCLDPEKVGSLLVEFNSDYSEFSSKMERYGFTTDNPFNKIENHSRVRRAREGIKVENVIFTRR